MSETVDYVRTADLSAARLRKAGVGARVETTPKAIANGLVKSKVYGVITGWGKHRWDVRVRKDGNTTTSTYHATFWTPSPAAKEPK
jgi:hypothetical protein